MYSFDSKIRYSEVDNKEYLTLGSIINYFQDCSTFQSDSINQGVATLVKRQKSWFLLTWQIKINRIPKLNEKIRISTWPTMFRGFLGNRNYMIEDEKGEKLILANTVWSLVDLNTHHPTKVAPEDMVGYDLEPALELEPAPRKIKVEDKGIEYESFKIRKMNLDTNNHVNNGQYVQMAAEYLEEDIKLSEIRVEYKKSAMLGEKIIPKVFKNSKEYIVTLNDTEDNIYATVQFILAE